MTGIVSLPIINRFDDVGQIVDYINHLMENVSRLAGKVTEAPMDSSASGKTGAFLFLVFGTLSFALAASFTKLCNFHATVIASFRVLIAGILLTPFCLRGLRAVIREKSPKELLLLIVPGVFLGLHFQFWVIGIKATYVATGTFIFSINPVLFAVAERFFYRRRFTFTRYISLALVVLGGVWLMISGQGKIGSHGDVLCFISTLLFVGYLVASERVAPGVPHLNYIHLTYLTAGLLTLPFVFASGAHRVLDLRDGPSWLLLMGIVILPTLIGHSSNTYAVRFFSPLLVSFFTLTEPLFSSAAAYFTLGEVPRIVEIPSFVMFAAATAVFLVHRMKLRSDK